MGVVRLDASDMLTRKEAAHMAGVTQRTLDKWIEEGRIEAYEVGPTARVRIPREVMEQALRPRKK